MLMSCLPGGLHAGRGGNQGLIKIITHGADKAPDCVPPTVVHESKLSARLDGGKTHGMVVVSKAVKMAIAKVVLGALSLFAPTSERRVCTLARARRIAVISLENASGVTEFRIQFPPQRRG